MIYRSMMINVRFPMDASWIHVVAMSKEMRYASADGVVGVRRLLLMTATVCGISIKPVERSEITRLDRILLDALLRSFGLVKNNTRTILLTIMIKVAMIMLIISVNSMPSSEL